MNGLQELKVFLESVNTSSSKKSGYRKDFICLEIKDNIGCLLLGYDISTGGEWQDELNRFYFGLEDIISIAGNIKEKEIAEINHKCVYAYQKSQHDPNYPEDNDYRVESVQKGRVRAKLALEGGSLKIDNLEFFPDGEKISWYDHSVAESHYDEIKEIALKQI